MNIAEMLARNARVYPDDVALIQRIAGQDTREEITWKEFDNRSNQIAAALKARGVRKGDKVIHLMMNSINWLVAYFGIIKTGAWAVPLNFRFTGKDIKYCIDVAEAKTMIVGKEFKDTVSGIRSELPIEKYIYVGDDLPAGMENFDKLLAESSVQPVEVEINDWDPCGLYFTSGTTGQPKPILLTHKNMECAAITENRHHYQTHEDNFILIPPLYHTGGKMHWFGSFIVGGRATILVGVDPKAIFKTVSEEKGTVVFLLVPWAQDILTALDRGDLKIADYDLSHWRLMHMGAQPIPPSLIKHWKEYFPSMQYDTNYGLSESTGPGCVHLGIENENKIGALGKPGFNWEVRIVDGNGNDVSQGEIGEIAVKGNGVMTEYYKNPEKTAETLRDGWLFTGDMGQIRDDCFIYMVDRKKDVIITGGENIYPVEVEEVILRQTKVNDVALIGIPDDRLGEIAVAIVDIKPGESITKAELENFCEQNLPRYKRPRYFIFDKVPRNPTGKIEKPKLREKYKQAIL
jgi:acyl-CoA synthetase (AMP-forming)/AMP-acid ligase II